MLWGSHPIGPDKLPSLTPFSRPCPLSPAERLPSTVHKSFILHTYPYSSFILAVKFQHLHAECYLKP